MNNIDCSDTENHFNENNLYSFIPNFKTLDILPSCIFIELIEIRNPMNV